MNSLLAKSSKDLEIVDEIIIVPSREEVERNLNAEDLINRLNNIQSPNQRLLALARSCFYLKDEPTHEAKIIRKMFLVGAIGGMFFGAILNSGDYTGKLIRQYNSAVFDGKYRAQRMYYDNLITGLSAKGLVYSFKTSLLTGSAGVIAFGSITYRNKLYLPDWLFGFTALGGLTRLWLGPRAVAVGGLLGCFAGIFGFGLAKGLEAASGLSVSQFKYLEHTEWLEARERKRLRLQAFQENHMKETLED